VDAEQQSGPSQPAANNGNSAAQPAPASPSQPSPSNTTTPVASNPSKQVSAAETVHRATSTSASSAVEARASLRRSATEEETAIEADRSRAAKIQKDRIIRGLLDAIVNTDKVTTSRTLLGDDDAEATKPSLVEKYYAEA
jgi:heme-binding NEAT domain protein